MLVDARVRGDSPARVLSPHHKYYHMRAHVSLLRLLRANDPSRELGSLANDPSTLRILRNKQQL